MELVHTVEWMRQAARQAREEGAIVGLVPTMGALHAGHLSLVRAACAACSNVVVSIFVNPTQFAPGEDYSRYPRTLDADRAAVAPLGVHYLFAPPVEEMYPPSFSTSVVVEGLSERFEGRSRPGHFRGVATVVLKLLEIVHPSAAYFGRKDAQQARIIRQMASDLALGSEIVVCPIVREPDGLALSSRNSYLDGRERAAATVLHRALATVRERVEGGERRAAPLVEEMRRKLAGEPLAAIDYAEIVNGDTFEPVTTVRGSCLAVLAAFIGSTRLLDNLSIEECNGRVTCTL